MPTLIKLPYRVHAHTDVPTSPSRKQKHTQDTEMCSNITWHITSTCMHQQLLLYRYLLPGTTDVSKSIGTLSAKILRHTTYSTTYLLPLFSHKICQHKHWQRSNCYNSSCKQMPNLLLNFSNCLTSRVFVKMSANCSSVDTCSRVTIFSSTRSLIKWCRIKTSINSNHIFFTLVVVIS
jgi:hypothetical protein